MMNRPVINGVLRRISEFLLYTGLALAALGIPALAFILWIMGLLGNTDPNYSYLMIAWLVSLLMFLLGVVFRKLSYDKCE